jgi:deoxyribonuclease V
MSDDLMRQLRSVASPAEARALQAVLADRVIARDDGPEPRFVAGTDVGFEDDGRVARGAVVVLDFPGLNVVDQALCRLPVTFPYLSGLLSFREIPVLAAAVARLSIQPDLILCDGQGLAHPRRFGLACHLGLILGRATIGVAKTRLIGSFEEPGRDKGQWTPLLHGDATIGAVVRSRAGTRPLFVSIGHRVSLAAAIRTVLACCTRYRLPETTRAAHRLASG